MSNTKELWIDAGYEVFASEGPEALKVEKLARRVGVNKSSFYHFFADLEVFIEELLKHHFSQAMIVVQKESEAKTQAELVGILMDHKLDLLFNRRLRIHREVEAYNKCFEEINQYSIPALLPLWAKIIGLEERGSLAKMVLMLSVENFFLQFTQETDATWLNNYLTEVQSMVKLFQNGNGMASVDGSV